MIKKLTKHGNSKALVLDRPVLDLLNIDDDTPLEISTDGDRLIISPVRDRGENGRKFEKAVAHAKERHGKAVKQLIAK